MNVRIKIVVRVRKVIVRKAIVRRIKTVIPIEARVHRAIVRRIKTVILIAARVRRATAHKASALPIKTVIRTAAARVRKADLPRQTVHKANVLPIKIVARAHKVIARPAIGLKVNAHPIKIETKTAARARKVTKTARRDHRFANGQKVCHQTIN